MTGGWSVGTLRADEAEDIAGWRYDPPYDLYDVDVAAPVLLATAGRFGAVRDEGGGLVGYCCFDAEARVPGGAYADAALDVGWGMRPELTGRGLGARFVAAIVAHALPLACPRPLRVTIAEWNGRSQRAAASAGFTVRRERFLAADGAWFLVLLQSGPGPDVHPPPQRPAATGPD
jgi:RimJ/RimL family protein N-acetyltransferase